MRFSLSLQKRKKINKKAGKGGAKGRWLGNAVAEAKGEDGRRR